MTELERDLDRYLTLGHETYSTTDLWWGVGAILKIWAETSFLACLGSVTAAGGAALSTVIGPFGLCIPAVALPQLALELANSYRTMTAAQRKGVRSVFHFIKSQVDWDELFIAGRTTSTTPYVTYTRPVAFSKYEDATAM